MLSPKFIAADFGAESGRLILGTFKNNRISLQEIHRFPNRQVKVFGHIYWDLLYLFDELKKGLRFAANQGHGELAGIGVDTWGVDFGLIGRKDHLLGNPYAYRDSRTRGMMEKAFKLIPRDEIYRITGIQFMQLNSLFQLLSMVETSHPFLDQAERLLFMPDLFNFLMTGRKVSEYSIASTSQLLNARTRQWSAEVFSQLNLPLDIMPEILPPGSVIGKLLPDICEETGLAPTEVITPAGHDTASAVAAVPAVDTDWAYLSSGTWSLLGVELKEPIITGQSLKNNFTNEGGVDNTIRFLRNNMGMWLLERCRKQWQQEKTDVSYDHLLILAAQASPFHCFIDPDDPGFLHPANMPQAIRQFCKNNQQPVPQSQGEIVRCIFESLALKYRFIVEKINSMRSQKIQKLHIVGGGSRNEMLNQFTANALGIPVYAGPVEATALGNILIQAISRGVVADLAEGRELVSASFPVKEFRPKGTAAWDEIYQKTRGYFERG